MDAERREEGEGAGGRELLIGICQRVFEARGRDALVEADSVRSCPTLGRR